MQQLIFVRGAGTPYACMCKIVQPFSKKEGAFCFFNLCSPDKKKRKEKKKKQRVFTLLISNVLANHKTLSSFLCGFVVILPLGFRIRDRCLRQFKLIFSVP